jgi:hypothetical protein
MVGAPFLYAREEAVFLSPFRCAPGWRFFLSQGPERRLRLVASPYCGVVARLVMWRSVGWIPEKGGRHGEAAEPPLGHPVSDQVSRW